MWCKFPLPHPYVPRSLNLTGGFPVLASFHSPLFPSLTFSTPYLLSAGAVGIYKSSTIPAVSRSADFTHGTALVLIWLVAEFTATIIACSIPFYRPLVRRFSSSAKRSGGSSSYGMSGMGKSGHSKLSSRTDVKAMPDDQGSDKDSLPLNARGVQRTDVFTLEYDSRDSNEGSQGHRGPGHARREMC